MKLTLPSLFDRFLDTPFASHLPEAFQSGVNEGRIDTRVIGNQRSIGVVRSFETENMEQEYHRSGHQHGLFSRSTTLPNGLKMDDVNSNYIRGIRILESPKVEPALSPGINVHAID